MPEPRAIPDLSPDQLLVMEDLFLGAMSVRQVCAKHQISTGVLYLWKATDAWKTEWNNRIAAQNDQAYRTLGTMTSTAVKTFHDCMKDPKAKWPDKLHAADSVMKFAGLEPPKRVDHSGTLTTQTPDAVAMAAEIAALEERERELLSKIVGDGG